MAKDDVNPLGLILPAGVAAYLLSPEVRKAVRGAVVRGVAGVMDAADNLSGLTDKLKGEVDVLVEDARKWRDEGRKSHEVKIVVAEDDAPEAEPTAA